MNVIWFAFLTGLTTGGISCLAVQGGLLASAITTPEDVVLTGVAKLKHKMSQVGMFVGTKLLSHTILGFFLGYLGSTLSLAPKTLGYVQIVVGLFMLATALRIANVHPIFRYFVIQPPRWAFRLLKNTSRSESFFAPALLGLFTVLMPCGVTQATMAVAIASGSPWLGASIMFAFILGTSPIFFALGATVVELLQKKIFSYAAAGIVALFAIMSINGGMGLTGSVYTLQNFYKAATTPISAIEPGSVAGVTDGVQEATITVRSNGYSSSVSTLKKDVPVRLTLVTNRTGGCARAFTIPDLRISKILPETGTEIIEFTPKKTGRLAYSCSMGMYTGQFTVIP